MSLAAVVALLQAALMLLTLVQAHPELGQSVRDNALQISQQAIVQATAALAASPPTSTSSSTASQPLNGPPVSTLITTQNLCPVVPVPTCTTTLTATYDINHCVTRYSCTPAVTTAVTSPPVTTSTGASCTLNDLYGHGSVYTDGQEFRVDCMDPNIGHICPGVSIIYLICHNGHWYNGYTNAFVM